MYVVCLCLPPSWKQQQDPSCCTLVFPTGHVIFLHTKSSGDPRGLARGGKGSKKLLAGRLKPPPKKAAKKPAKKPAAKRTGKNAGLPPSQEWIGEAPDVTGITEVISPDLLPDRLKPKATGLAAWFG